jgi:hypothetical protein
MPLTPQSTLLITLAAVFRLPCRCTWPCRLRWTFRPGRAGSPCPPSSPRNAQPTGGLWHFRLLLPWLTVFAAAAALVARCNCGACPTPRGVATHHCAVGRGAAGGPVGGPAATAIALSLALGRRGSSLPTPCRAAAPPTVLPLMAGGHGGGRSPSVG